MFSKQSRYAKVKEAEWVDSKGRNITYKRIRFIPPTRPQRGHIITEGERLDHIAYFYYKDARRFWRICDANAAMFPDDLADDIGRKIKIPPAQD
ncbi:MAG TPA: hypothetical protein DDY14_10740 [Chromatiaceae bacterium]|jgi:hypothetical protein|nr:MAG: hypothetical protein N838_00435 [Thiohalocapsa sp. PB-PSB1]QQO57356.1 MAG: hypothetical protein N838_32405 [Thiohalocapsa sp. PB-PSB1]HBG95770.1 hypothetical protein [Chromatiaceae bacterium]HCS88838.1 hypothetical protein [Chromatiaceae bacterium]